MIKLEPKKDCWQKDIEITVNNIFAVAEWTCQKDIGKLARKELREYIKGLKIAFEKEIEREEKINDLKNE